MGTRGSHGKEGYLARSSSSGLKGRGIKVLVLAVPGVAVMGGAVAVASHGDDFIDLASSPNLTVEHDGAAFV